MTAPDLQRQHRGASCAVWLHGPTWEGRQAAAIGRFTCDSAEDGVSLLAEVTAELRDEGCRAVLGPMDGDTWHTYRLVVESDARPPFLLEPPESASAVEAFGRAGFVPVADYVSSIADSQRLRCGLRGAGGVILRSFDPSRAEDELRTIFRLSRDGFAGNAFYTPITEADFLNLYRPVLPRLVPDLVLLAEDAGGVPLGFIFCLPDFAGGLPPATLIVKTYAAIRPGVGSILVDGAHRAARRMGFAQVIHALMHADNKSLRHSTLMGGQIFRRYSLFGTVL